MNLSVFVALWLNLKFATKAQRHKEKMKVIKMKIKYSCL